MNPARQNGLALCGIGVAVGTYVAPQLGLEPPRLVLIVLFAAAGLMVVGGFARELIDRRGTGSQTPGLSTQVTRTGPGSVSGNIINNSTVHAGTGVNSQVQPAGHQFLSAIANVETELERTAGQIEDATETGRYRRRFPTMGSRHYEMLSELLAVRGLSSERRDLSQTYRQFERLNNRMRERKWSGGAIPEMTIPDVRQEDGLDELNRSITSLLETLSDLRASIDGNPRIATAA